MNDSTAIAVIVDKSGSMYSKREDVIGGFNTFLKEQQELPDQATLTLIMFNTDYKVVFLDKPLKDVTPLTDEDYQTGGNTALLDAVGTCIDTLGKKLAETPNEKRPSKVIVVIMTDGEENSSREYTYKDIQDKIEHQREKYNWEFLFVGAGIDAFKGAHDLGISMDKALSVSNSSAGVRSAYCNVSVGVKRYRKSGKVGNFSSSSSGDSK